MRRIKILAALLALCLLCGCSGMSVDELYCLPEASEDYYNLQDALNEVLEQNYSYHAPSSGARREPVQLVDLDHDGVDEAVAFFRSNEDGTVSAAIFSRQGDSYQKVDEIPCSGSAVGSVEYADLDGSGSLEILITCQVSDAVTQALQVSRYSGGTAQQLLTAPCSRYELVDLDRKGGQEILTIADGGADAMAEAVYYTLADGKIQPGQELVLGGCFSDILNIQEGTLEDDIPAVLVTSKTEAGLATDVMVLGNDGALMQVDCGELAVTASLSGGSLYPTDIDGDGCIEIPSPVDLPAEDAAHQMQAVEWFGLTSGGSAAEKSVTYYQWNEKWYFVMPESWWGQITAEESSETQAAYTIHTVTFRRWKRSQKAGDTIMTIYAIWGADRQTQAEQRKLTSLYSDTDMILAVDIPTEVQPWEGTVSVAQVSERFHLERTDSESGSEDRTDIEGNQS